MKRFVLCAVAVFLFFAFPAAAEKSADFYAGYVRIGPASDTCTSTIKGAIRYNSTSNLHKSCNGTAWAPWVQVQSTPGPTAPAGSGYFVLTHTTWDGNLGGLAGADAKCLTELGTTYTSWRGYATANSNGQLTAGKVHAFLCEVAGCNNLMPLTSYYFAYANSGTPGGAVFTTDATGVGPNDTASWAAANYFSGTYSYWMNRGGWEDGYWENTDAFPGWIDCTSWTDNSGADDGTTANSANTNSSRWANNAMACNQSHRLICYVNP